MEGAKVMEVPAIKITDPDDFAPLDAAQKNLASYDWVIFTSANGVDLFFDRLLQNGKDARAFAHNKIAAIGTATADMLTAYGLTADLIPASYKAEDLVDTLLPQLHKGSKVLLARAKEARNVLPDSLRAAGHCNQPAESAGQRERTAEGCDSGRHRSHHRQNHGKERTEAHRMRRHLHHRRPGGSAECLLCSKMK